MKLIVNFEKKIGLFFLKMKVITNCYIVKLIPELCIKNQDDR